MKVCLLGLGYIGLPTAALIASRGIDVRGIDVNVEVVDTINKGEIHIVEPELDAIVKAVVMSNNLHASVDVIPSDVFVIAVPTPFKGDFEPDISFVQKAVENIIPHLKEGNLLIIESTSPIATTEKMYSLLVSQRPELEGKIYMAYCPERVLPGNVIYELQHNDRVIGGLDEKSTQKAIVFYSKFVEGKLHATNARTAEMCKLVENASRDVNIAFANELSMISEKANINVHELIELANKHPRVDILQPGIGVGGHCIAVDPWFIVSDYPEEAKIIRVGREINNYKTEWVIKSILQQVETFQKLKGTSPKVACLGLAYKPNIDDLRESPAIAIVDSLISAGIDLLISEPNIKKHSLYKISDLKEIEAEADIVVFLVKHSAYDTLSQDGNIIYLDYCGALHK